jgi:hypothetical protein
MDLVRLPTSVVDRHRHLIDAYLYSDPTFRFDDGPDPDPTPIVTHIGKIRPN